MTPRHWLANLTSPLSLLLLLLVAACAVKVPSDPLGTLSDPAQLPSLHEVCLTDLDKNLADPQYQRVLRRIVSQPGYPVATRRAALARCIQADRAGLIAALELTLPKMDALEWRRELCGRIAALNWKEMTPTLIRAWARPMGGWIPNPADRPEALALAQMWGADRVPDVIFDTMLKADPITESNLRARCWELLVLTGNRARLVELLKADPAQGAPPDALLFDLRRAANEVGVLPCNREEILWLQALTSDKHAELWRQACQAVRSVPPEVRAELTVKDLPVIVAVAAHRSDLLKLTRQQMYDSLAAHIEEGAGERHTATFEGWGGGRSETLASHRNQLTWGDCAAISLALEALRIPQVREHIFNLADRDLQDLSSEHGGLLRLDSKGRFEISEYPPRVRGGDLRFEASNQMFEDGYGAISHFHCHAQAYENSRYAGPHLGDFTYADATGVNGIVFTFISHNRINVDYYRRGEVVVDLGTIQRPGSS
ncbi:MAG: hypothetical protein EXS00_08760 [Phycisphaerales bacterium]|nr:hypothetical protein [Phycisphaerales bacterium]